MIGDEFYLFYNAHGTVSLVTPNYAGNVETKGRRAIMNGMFRHHLRSDILIRWESPYFQASHNQSY